MIKWKSKNESIQQYLASVRGHYEKGLDMMLLKKGMSLVAEARFHLVVSIQTLQGGSCDVHLTENTGTKHGAVKAKNQVPGSQSIMLSLVHQCNSPLGLLNNSLQYRNFYPNDSFNLVTSSNVTFLYFKQDKIEPVKWPHFTTF